MVYTVGPAALLGHGLSSQPFLLEVVVVKLVSLVQDWKDFTNLSKKLQILPSVFASKSLSALGLYRFLFKNEDSFFFLRKKRTIKLMRRPLGLRLCSQKNKTSFWYSVEFPS